GGSTPYRPLIEALAPWARAHQPSDVDLGAHNRAYGVLVPGWASSPADPLSPVFVAEALLRLLPHISPTGQTLLVLEDQHWEGPGARRTIRALAARGAMRLLRLMPLDAASTRELAERRLGRPITAGLTSLLVERSEGLPLFVEELLSALELSGSLVTEGESVD